MKCYLVLLVTAFVVVREGTSAYFKYEPLAPPCITPLGLHSSCVSIYDCPEMVAAIKQPSLSTEVINLLRRSSCGFDGSKPKVCCGPLPTDLVQDPKPDSSGYGGSLDPVSSEDSTLAQQCGVDASGSRLFGGVDTGIDEYPWMALLGYRNQSGTLSYLCGGVLINRRYVLTAAHCVTSSAQSVVGKLETIRLGEYDLTTDPDCRKNDCTEPVQDINVQNVYPHTKFDDDDVNRIGDIAIIRLAKRAQISDFVKPICLAESDPEVSTNTTLNTMQVCGWGMTLSGKSSNVKQKLGVQLFDKSQCSTKFRTLGVDLTDKQICAGGTFGEDSCKGDSGGPMMRPRPDGVWESVGVVSFGYGCAREGWPAIYTSVAGYLDWIKTVLETSNV